ncbi:M23 family metallopeptidase [Heyndrickxia camelliae]|uniref:Peptidase M23 n=1 Tax=Heyndrickxia camelliae TaxID=1707093 RepID=A0A2N3LF30_9BACI|nr:M23 family metallopeptidase [Heyndrickxia camelliae]PKR83238.1 peptidase M23 [Heyndrickxia camelliae]
MREEEKKLSSQKKRGKSIFKKRWVYPAVYLVCAALLISGIFWYQSKGNESAKDNFNYRGDDLVGKKEFKNPATEVSKTLENFKWPVKNASAAKIVKDFYDSKASAEKQEAAILVYNGNQFRPNRGVDIAMKDGKDFNVVAAMSGTVVNVNDNDSLLGNVIEIEHEKGVVTEYQSVQDIQVKVGDIVEQGQTIAKAGKSQLNEKAGTHVHFEIRKDNQALNPNTYFNKPLSALENVNTESKSATDDQMNSDDQSSKTKDDNAAENEDNNNSSSEKNDSQNTDDSQG